MSKAKAPAKASAKPSGELRDAKGRRMVPQPHGGALVPGAGGGPQPGGGRPPDSHRAEMRRLLKERLAPKAVEVVSQSADGDLHLRAIELFARVAGESETSDAVPADEVRSRVMRTVELISRMVPEETARPLLEELRAVWS